jgi:hypothetical protein
MSAINIVQTCTNNGTGSAPANAASTQNITATFGSPVTAANTIVLVTVGHNNGPAGGGMYGPTGTITDSAGNSYRQVMNAAVPYESGPGIGFFFVPSAVGGTTSITPSFYQVGGPAGTGFNYTILALEYSGMNSPVIQASWSQNFYTGGNPNTQTITDSYGRSVTVSFSWTSGTDISVALVDMLVNGLTNFLIGIYANNNNAIAPTATPSSYTFTHETTANSTGLAIDYFDSGVPYGYTVLKQPQIFVVT